MTTRRFLYERPDGGISVIVVAPKSRRKDDDVEVWLKRDVSRTIQEAEKHLGPCRLLPECDCTLLPDREYLNAWRANPDGTIRVDETEKQKIIAGRARITILEKQPRG